MILHAKRDSTKSHLSHCHHYHRHQMYLQPLDYHLKQFTLNLYTYFYSPKMAA